MPDPIFPPLLNGHDVKGAASAFEAARERAAAGELGAGDVVWSRNADRLDLAIVLEPDVGLDTAVQMMPVSMVAIGDCLGALTPPQVAVTFTWPNKIRINGGLAGEIRAAVADPADKGAPPDWMVLGLRVQLRRRPSDPEPGNTPERTWLSEEGGENLTRTELIESFCRHFLTWLNDWNEDGFRGVHDSWLYRAEEREGKITVETGRGKKVTGAFLGLDDAGNLLIKRGGKTSALYLADHFERVAHAGAES